MHHDDRTGRERRVFASHAQSNTPRRSNACRFTWRSPMHRDDRTVEARGERLLPMRSPMHHEDRMHAAPHGAVQWHHEDRMWVWRARLLRRGTTHPKPAVRTLPPLLIPWGCTPSSPAFLHRGENGHFLLIPHIPQKDTFDSLNLERHLTFRLSSPIGRFSFPVFPDVLKGFPFFARSIIEPMFCVLQSRPAS